ncbi:MAG TPA: hypothetical protein VGA09_08000 [Candidatus Binatia bacterium]
MSFWRKLIEVVMKTVLVPRSWLVAIAKQIGITIPPSTPARADRVIK